MSSQTIYKSPEGERKLMALYDYMLANWSVAHETLTLPTRHGDTFVIVSGDKNAEPLVLLHGAGTNSAVWIGDVAVYSRHFRVYAVDLLGEPGKSAPNRPSWESPAYQEWLSDVLDALKLDRVSMVGISQGGWTALKFATATPERIKKLALICPGGIIPDKLSFVFKVIPLMMLGKWGVQRIVKMLYADQPIPEGVTDILITYMTHFKARFGTLPIFSDQEVARLMMPVLLVGGTKDPLRDLDKIAARLQGLLPKLSIRLIQGGGHALNDTADDILTFLLAE